jgi:hypothetical protein
VSAPGAADRLLQQVSVLSRPGRLVGEGQKGAVERDRDNDTREVSTQCDGMWCDRPGLQEQIDPDERARRQWGIPAGD